MTRTSIFIPIKVRRIALIIICALWAAPLQLVAARQEQTRPRRVNPEALRETTAPERDTRTRERETTQHAPESTNDEAARDEATRDEARRNEAARDERQEFPASIAHVELHVGNEPFVRIGLATDARSAAVSTAGKLISVEVEGSPATLVAAARLRVEPRSYPPLPSRTNDESDAANRTENATLRANTRPTSAAAQANAPKSGVKLTSRLSSAQRGAAVFAHGESAPRLDVRGPVTFSSSDEESDPVRFGDKPYRGRIEVFTNTRGLLTVVNVVALEDYVRGVVPNELSPGGWPQLEALKAQAVAARTYAVSNRGRFGAQGFDLLPTARSQVYGGRSTEHSLTDRAVAETRGIVITHAGRLVNALYTSTCGGRTEDAEEIFGGDRVPYLRARECVAETAQASESFVIRTSRELPQVRSAEHAESVRDAALLSTQGFRIPAQLNDEWLASPLTIEEARQLTSHVAALARQQQPTITNEATRPAGFASALFAALDGESRASTLLNRADVEYLLSFRDAADVPERSRADVALMLRDGIIRLYPDATLRPLKPLARWRALNQIAAALEARRIVRLQKATARQSEGGALVLAPAGGKGANRTLKTAREAFIFKVFGGHAYPARDVRIIGGEPVVFHLNDAGEVDYMEVGPAPNGAASDRFSKFSHWSETMTPDVLLSRLGRTAKDVGTLLDVRVLRRGASGRVLDLEVIGTSRTINIRGGRVRTALGLREQLFVVEREHDADGRVQRFNFYGRGWGHGVGMCQVGAYGLARMGLKYERILSAYYTDTRLAKLY